MRSPAAIFGRLWESRVSPLPLAVFRIAFALVSLLEVRQIFRFRALVFDAVPGVVTAPWWVTPLLFLWMAALGALIVGWRTRLAAAVNYVIVVPVVGVFAMRNGFEWHFDTGFLTGSLLMLLSPVGAALSVDRLRARGRDAAGRRPHAPREVPALHAAFLALAVGLMYWDSILWKATSEIHTSGLGFWAPASLPFNTFMDISPLLGPEALVRGVGYLVLLFEASFLALVWVRRLRLPVVAAGVGFHAAIMLAFPIPLFSLQMIAFYLGIVPAESYERIARAMRRRRPSVSVYYDADCPLCRRAAAVLAALDPFGEVRWLALQEHAAAVPELAGIGRSALLRDMHAVGAGGRVRAGAAAYAAILRAMRWTAPLGWLLSVPPASAAARLVYGRIAERRRRDRACDDASCAADALVSPAPPFARLPRWLPERRILAAFAAFWLVSVAVIALASPFHRVYLPFSHETHERLERVGDRWREVVYPWTGFAAHGVFMDRHFARYDRQLMLVQRSPSGEREFPLTRADGTSGAWGWGRAWAHWIFRTAAPTLPRSRREAGLRRWVDYWIAEGGDPRDGEIVVRERTVDVSLGEWRDGLAARNRAREWRDVARIAGEPGALRVEWLARPGLARDDRIPLQRDP